MENPYGNKTAFHQLIKKSTNLVGIIIVLFTCLGTNNSTILTPSHVPTNIDSIIASILKNVSSYTSHIKSPYLRQFIQSVRPLKNLRKFFLAHSFIDRF